MPQIRNFADVHIVLAKYVDRNKQTGSYTLERIKTLMSVLGNPQDSYKIVHVAGTSGKTSTCYYLAALLQAAGQKVGMTVSPHVDEVNERLQINLNPLPEKQFCRQLQKFITIVDKTGIKLTYFELLVAFAYWEFAQQKVDYAVVEVGLGGLLDGTNVIHRPDKICVITDIGLDHINVLGNTISKIATQKAGIIQDHNNVFIYQQSADVMERVVKRCKLEHAVLQTVQPEPNESNFKQRDYYLAKNVFDFIAQNESWPSLDSAKLLKITSLNIPARMEIAKYHGRTLVIDGSHNGQKMAALVAGIQEQYPHQRVSILASFVAGESDRAPDALRELYKLTDQIIVTAFASEQDAPKQSLKIEVMETLASKAGFKNIQTVADPASAFQLLLKQPSDILLVTGSFYLLNHIRPLILHNH